MNSDQKIECDRLNNEIWSEIEKLNSLKIQQADAENNLSRARGELSDLNYQLSEKRGLLFAANVGSLIPGVGGKVGGAISIPVLEREIQRLEREIERVKSDLDQEQREIDSFPRKIDQQNYLINGLRQRSDSLGCA